MTKTYTKQTWTDEVLAAAERYNILEDGGGAFKSNMQINLATTVTTPGTAITASRLNHIEDGIDAIDDILDWLEEGLNTVVLLNDADLIPVSVSSAWKTIRKDNFVAQIYDEFDIDILTEEKLDISGWQPRSETWTRTGNHTFTISGDVTAIFRKGTKVWYRDGGGDEYGVVASSSYGAPNTTVNLIVNTDYTMAAATITNKHISHIENPSNWPDWFNWAPTYTGFSSDPPSTNAKWRVQGKTIYIAVNTGNGTSNATGFTITNAPVAALFGLGYPMGSATDNGAVLTTATRIVTGTGTTTWTLRANMASGAWTNANNKAAQFSFFYEF